MSVPATLHWQRLAFIPGELLNSPKLLLEHKVLSDSDAKKISEKYKVPLNKFPKISSKDPQVLKIEAQAGQLIAINRVEWGKSYVYYRVVTD